MKELKIFLLILLVIVICLAIAYPLFERKLTNKDFIKLIDKKIKRFSNRNDCKCICGLHLSNFEGNPIYINQIVYGKKFIYLVYDIFLNGHVTGGKLDNSWVYANNIKKTMNYLDNLNVLLKKNIDDFTEILNINKDPIISICVTPNECDIKVKDINEENVKFTHFSALNSLISKFEDSDIGELEIEDIDDQINTIKTKNEKEN